MLALKSQYEERKTEDQAIYGALGAGQEVPVESMAEIELEDAPTGFEAEATEAPVEPVTEVEPEEVLTGLRLRRSDRLRKWLQKRLGIEPTRGRAGQISR